MLDVTIWDFLRYWNVHPLYFILFLVALGIVLVIGLVVFFKGCEQQPEEGRELNECDKIHEV